MKIYKLLLVTFIAIVVASGSCKKAEELLTFDISDSTDILIDNTIVPFNSPFDIPTPDITTNSQSEFAANNAQTDWVKNILLKELSAEIIYPEGKTFSFLKEIYIYISTSSDDEILLASKSIIDSNATQIFLDVTDESLDKYVKSDSYKLRTAVVTRETLTQDIKVRVFLTYGVTVALQ